MFCKNCGTPTNPSEQFCKKCGAPVVPAAPAYPSGTYAVAPAAKRSPWMMVVGIILLVVALGGLIFSFTTDAKILGKWREHHQYYSYDSDAVIFEFGMFNKLKVQTSVNGIPTNVPTSYNLSGNMLTLQSGFDYTSVRTVPIVFLNHNTIIADGDSNYPLIRMDSVATYMIIMIASVFLAVVGIILIGVSMRKPKTPAPMMYPTGFAGAAPIPPVGGVRMGTPNPGAVPGSPAGGVRMSTPDAAGVPAPGATPVVPGEGR